MIRLTIDKIGSSSKNVPLTRDIRLSEVIVAKEGYVVAGRICNNKSFYNKLENIHGRMVPLHEGDTIIGVLGHRNALHGYAGYVPDEVNVGDRLNVLNLGGVIGVCTSYNPEVGPPFEVEILGGVLVFPLFGDRTGVQAHVSMNALPKVDSLESFPQVPIIFVVGTSMNSGKTVFCSETVRALASKGLRVAGCKLTGVSLLKDILEMQDYGAVYARSFMDSGIVTTSSKDSVTAAKSILGELSSKDVDVIVAELGDGLMGDYGVREILSSSEIIKRGAVFVLCAHDPVGAWGGVKFLKENLGICVGLVSGPTTDHEAGTFFIKQNLNVIALNARKQRGEIGEFLFSQVMKGEREY